MSYNTASGSLLIMVVNGDSITGCGAKWPFQYIGIANRGDCSQTNGASYADLIQYPTYVAGDIRLKVIATGGAHLVPQMNGAAATFADPVPSVKSIKGSSSSGSVPRSRKWLYVIAAGSNDTCINGYGTVAEYASTVGAHIQARKSAGFDLAAICSVLPRNDADGNETNRAAYNALVGNSSWRASYGINYLIDMAAEPTMGLFATCSDTTYYSDGVHPTDVGVGLLVTNQVIPVMNTILAGL